LYGHDGSNEMLYGVATKAYIYIFPIEVFATSFFTATKNILELDSRRLITDKASDRQLRQNGKGGCIAD
jgi:hypothetical protein